MWLKPRDAMFIAPYDAVQQQVDHIVNTYTALVSAGNRSFRPIPL
ncbi:hypothetical protein ACVI1L_004740 [Bradyrhizobium sp. USDA 4516]|nr:hypothetical protein [Bradyrhizobium sp. USDA 4541]MCP1854506.1 hypothetical protein [Bradyrhizobium sp. USDA 4541]